MNLTVEAAGTAWMSAEMAYQRTLEKIQKIRAKIAAVQAELDAGSPDSFKLLKKLSTLTTAWHKATESMSAHYALVQFADELVKLAREAEKGRKNGSI